MSLVQILGMTMMDEFNLYKQHVERELTLGGSPADKTLLLQDKTESATAHSSHRGSEKKGIWGLVEHVVESLSVMFRGSSVHSSAKDKEANETSETGDHQAAGDGTQQQEAQGDQQQSASEPQCASPPVCGEAAETAGANPAEASSGPLVHAERDRGGNETSVDGHNAAHNSTSPEMPSQQHASPPREGIAALSETIHTEAEPRLDNR